MAEKTIAQAYELRDVSDKLYRDEIYTATPGMPDPNLIVGVELEIEGVRINDNILGFHWEADGSLRNGGMEAISAPTKAQFFEKLLTAFFTKYKVTAANYSERCSTHMHFNVQDLTWNQVKIVCMLYQMFERLLFNFVGQDRKDNIFCVPWYESGLSSRFLDKMQRDPHVQAKMWVKYSALNLIPIGTQGTMEFRHLYGTCDVNTIMGWMKLISCLFVYAKKTTIKQLVGVVQEMNTVSNYDAFITDVFGEHRFKLMQGTYREALSVGVIDTKMMIIKREEKDAPRAGWFDEAPVAQAAAPVRRPRNAPRFVRDANGNIRVDVPAGAQLQADAVPRRWIDNYAQQPAAPFYADLVAAAFDNLNAPEQEEEQF